VRWSRWRRETQRGRGARAAVTGEHKTEESSLGVASWVGAETIQAFVLVAWWLPARFQLHVRQVAHKEASRVSARERAGGAVQEKSSTMCAHGTSFEAASGPGPEGFDPPGSVHYQTMTIAGVNSFWGQKSPKRPEFLRGSGGGGRDKY